MVQDAFAHEPLLKSVTRIQPAGRTLVQLPTIFSTVAPVQSFDEVLLGHAARLVATPVSYVWVFGDGQSLATVGPGRPYPAKDVTHVYGEAGVTVAPSVRVTYRGRYSLDGGPWEDVPEPVTIQGPASEVLVVQARAELVSGE